MDFSACAEEGERQGDAVRGVEVFCVVFGPAGWWVDGEDGVVD